jgi:hypothetical protein
VQLSRIGTLLGFLDIDSSPAQLGMPMTTHPKRPSDPNQLAKSIIDIRERPMRRMAFSRV